ncbi:BGTF surface domain-containing protein [Halorussus ruber]|uniref:BGTF surface domain-containing protein n=1 Tax=Halorussus ruber TaxID=1126238 RepID=UPI00143E0843|nr:BGTF surface domain-containing protein [Halorussus ruber]
MSARPPQCAVAAVAVALLAATVVPWVGAGTATAAGSASFAETAVYEQSGDVANITVTTSKAATVNLGSPETNFWLQVRVSSGTTTLRLNTYKAGESNRYELSEMVWAAEGSISSRRLRTPAIDAPLEPARYQMNVTTNGQEQALAALVVEERATNDVTARIAPERTDTSKLETAADVKGASVAPWGNGSVARGDWLFLRVDASGVRGPLVESGGGLDTSQLDGEEIRVAFEQTNAMNEQSHTFTGAEAERVITGGDFEGFYLAVDTGNHSIEAGDRYEVRFTIPERSELADSKQTVSTDVRVAERRVNIEEYHGETLTVEDDTTFHGKTTLTPGSTVNISARSAAVPPFHYPRTVTVSGERTFEVSFDFSDLEAGREFQIRLSDQKRSIPAQMKPPETTTAAPTTTANDSDNQTTTPPQTPTATTTTKTTATTTTKTTAEGLTQVGMGDTRKPLTQQAAKNGTGGDGDGGGGGGPIPSVPGFGPVASVVAVLAAALLAARRR